MKRLSRLLLSLGAPALAAASCTSILGNDFVIGQPGAGGESGGGSAECSPGTTTCADDTTLVTCDDQGRATETTCADPTPVCAGDACRECATAEQRCDANGNVEVCQDGAFQAGSTCDMGCDAGECLSVVDLGAGIAHTCAVLSNGTVRCWGYNALQLLFTDSLDDPGVVGTFTTSPEPVPDLATAVLVEGGDASSCALTLDQTLQCWGWNGAGQLGSEDFQDHTSPYTVVLDDQVIDFAVGVVHTCVVLANGTLQCWGLNEDGQLGNGMIDNPTFVPQHQTVALALPAAEVHAGAGTTCSVSNALEAACWGNNSHHELANLVTTDSGLPVGVLGEGVTEIVPGVTHVCARAGNEMSCWGRNAEAQIGLGTTGMDVMTPTAVPGVAPVRIALGQGHTCIIDTSDQMQCWGRNDEGQIGNGMSGVGTNQLSPFTVPIGAVVDITLGYYHTCALTVDGQVLCWGINNHGQLGTGDTTLRSMPTAVVW